jgi:hypothetical protein
MNRKSLQKLEDGCPVGCSTVHWYEFANVTEACTASIIRAMTNPHHNDDAGSSDL